MVLQPDRRSQFERVASLQAITVREDRLRLLELIEREPSVGDEILIPAV